MHPTRIAELLEPFLQGSSATGQRPRANDALCRHISTYIDILLRWNARINLTAIRDPEEIVTRHFGESLFAARNLFPESTDSRVETGDSPVDSRRTLGNNLTPAPKGPANDLRLTTDGEVSAADLGSGAGFPGIPIKLWAPHLALTLIESNHKKTAFLREIVRALTLTNVNVFPGRAGELLQQRSDPGLTSEEHDQPGRTKPGQSRRNRHKPAESVGRPRPGSQSWSQTTHRPQSPEPGGFDLVTLRAVERFASILPVAASLVSPGGRLALLIGASQLDLAQTTLPTLAWDPPLPVPRSQSRTLLIAHIVVEPIQ
jgi:16S rRNA G527 N7-methylase RsmG